MGPIKDFIGLFRTTQDYTGLYRTIQDYTRLYKTIRPVYSRVYKALQVFTRL